MIKKEEQDDPKSCFNRALPGERIFVLLSRDPAAPSAIRQWVHDRIRLGKEKWEDPKLVEARACADAMDAEREAVRAQVARAKEPVV